MRVASFWVACMLALSAGCALAAESAPATTPRGTATLITDTDAVSPGQPFHAALRLQVAPGWHTYWRNPGDAGVAANLEWTLPTGATAGPIIWPTPHRQPEGPLMTYGFTGELVLPVEITPGPVQGPIALHANWLVCEKICVPEEASFRLDLPVGTPSASPQAGLITAAVAAAPRPSPWPATIGGDGRLAVTGLSRASVAAAWFIPSEYGTIDPSAPQTLSLQDDGFSLSLRQADDAKPNTPLDGVLVVRDPSGQETAVDLHAVPGLSAAPTDLWRVLSLALLGGLILNLMPCVFPILAMKAVGLASLSGADRSQARGHALSYLAGILLGFLAIGGALLVLRGAGMAVGWGFQFQSPIFVALTAWVLFAVGLNLSGVFGIGAGALAGAGQSLTRRPAHAGSFFTGLLAVAVATPCTAPFMGAALAAALTLPPAETLLIFAAIGLGLAAPYVVIAMIPGLARALPRPGRWMELLKQALAFPMYAAAAWLVWVLSQEAGPDGVLAGAAGLVILGFAAWALGIAQVSAFRLRRAAFAGALAAAIAALALLPGLSATGPTTAAAAEPGIEPFSTARLAELRAQGRPVFVNITAAWCVTCLVNERIALSPEAVRDAFAQHDVAYLKGDWTRQDPSISAYLRAQGRDGVPLYVFYPAGQGAPEVLPQILTEAEMLRRAGA